MAHRIAGLLAQHTVRHRADRAIRVNGDEVERLTKIDDEMPGQHRNVFKLTVDLNLQARRAGIEYRDKSIVGMGPKPQSGVRVS